MKTVVMRNIWRVTEVDHPSQLGWYYCYSLPPHDSGEFTMEHGPFPTEEAARLDAEAAFPANWTLNGDG